MIRYQNICKLFYLLLLILTLKDPIYVLIDFLLFNFRIFKEFQACVCVCVRARARVCVRVCVCSQHKEEHRIIYIFKNYILFFFYKMSKYKDKFVNILKINFFFVQEICLLFHIIYN